MSQRYVPHERHHLARRPGRRPPGRAVRALQGRSYTRRYWLFALPAAIVVTAVIVFPRLFTLCMSVHDWKVSGTTPFVGLANYLKMLPDNRFEWVLL